jgi:hypothetical protein
LLLAHPSSLSYFPITARAMISAFATLPAVLLP